MPEGEKQTWRERYAQARENMKHNKAVQWLQDNRVPIGIGVGCFVAGHYLTAPKTSELQQVAKNTALLVWKSPPTNIALVKCEMPQPIPVRYKPTGEDFRSINRASKLLKMNPHEISKDAQGAQNLFERLPDSVFA